MKYDSVVQKVCHCRKNHTSKFGTLTKEHHTSTIFNMLTNLQAYVQTDRRLATKFMTILFVKKVYQSGY